MRWLKLYRSFLRNRRYNYNQAQNPNHIPVVFCCVPTGLRLRIIFLDPPRKAGKSMKRNVHATCRPAKIAPLKPPKEIHNDSTPRCAMQAKSSDH